MGSKTISLAHSGLVMIVPAYDYSNELACLGEKQVTSQVSKPKNVQKWSKSIKSHKSLRSLTLAVNVASERAPHRRERRSLLLYLAAAVTMSLAYVGSPTLTQILGSTFASERPIS